MTSASEQPMYCRDCHRVRDPRYFRTPHAIGLCIDCWWRRWGMNQMTTRALDLGDDDPEPKVSPTPLALLGYRRTLHSMWICVRCAVLYERGKPYESAQLCACHIDGPRETWPGYDYNEHTHLCECCCAHVLPSGSRWSTWFCDSCKPYVGDLNGSVGHTVIPVGRHTLMMREGPAMGRPTEGESIEHFADRLYQGMDTLGAKIDVLQEHRRTSLKHQFREAGLPLRDVRLVRYLEITRRWDQDASSARSFERLARRFGYAANPEEWA